MATIDGTNKSTRVKAAVAAAIVAMGLTGAAHARTVSGPVPVDLTVVDRETGQVLPTWRHNGRLFVAGQPGARYGLRVTNHTDGRLLVVMSVDGVNVLTGETAGHDQRGYVFLAHQSYDVTGWRKSNSEVAAFTFAPLPESYAARTGRPADVGVIGIAAFREKLAPPPPPLVSAERRDEPDRYAAARSQGLAGAPVAMPAPPPAAAARGYTAADAAAAAAPKQAERLGTAHGAREWSTVTLVNFERATSFPQFTRQIEYNTYANLVEAGVIEPPVYRERHPSPFPTEPDGAGYVPDPPNEP